MRVCGVKLDEMEKMMVKTGVGVDTFAKNAYLRNLIAIRNRGYKHGEIDAICVEPSAVAVGGYGH